MPMKNYSKGMFLWVFLMLVLMLAFTVVSGKDKTKILEKLGYTEGDEEKIHETVAGAL